MDIESTAELVGYVSLYCILGTIKRYNFIQGQVNRAPLQKVFQEQGQNRIVRLQRREHVDIRRVRNWTTIIGERSKYLYPI